MHTEKPVTVSGKAPFTMCISDYNMGAGSAGQELGGDS